MRKNCKRCGKEIVVKSNKKYCGDCRSIVIRERNRKYHYTMYKGDKNFRRRAIDSVLRYQKRNPYRTWATGVISNHRVRGLIVKITIAELIKLAKNIDECSICGCRLDYGYKGKSGWSRNSPSLDRVTNSKIMSINTVQIICTQCNMAKNSMTMDEFIDYCRLVTEKALKKQ